jgi:ABC-type microcin C transport system permease subunit YejB
MLRYLLRRLAQIVPTLFFVSVLIFGLQQLLPGDPALALAGEDRDPETVKYLREKFHIYDRGRSASGTGSRACCRATSATRCASRSRSPS